MLELRVDVLYSIKFSVLEPVDVAEYSSPVPDSVVLAMTAFEAEDDAETSEAGAFGEIPNEDIFEISPFSSPIADETEDLNLLKKPLGVEVPFASADIPATSWLSDFEKTS